MSLNIFTKYIYISYIHMKQWIGWKLYLKCQLINTLKYNQATIIWVRASKLWTIIISLPWITNPSRYTSWKPFWCKTVSMLTSYLWQFSLNGLSWMEFKSIGDSTFVTYLSCSVSKNYVYMTIHCCVIYIHPPS